MTYALIAEGAVAAYPYSIPQLRRDNPQTSFPAEPPDELLAEWGVYPVADVDPPLPTVAQNLAEGTPVLANGVWTQAWVLTDASAGETAARQKEAAHLADWGAVKADSFVPTFLAMTPAEISTYVDNNTANLAQTRALLKKMALMLLVGARRTLG